MEQKDLARGKVFICGAGPGDPKLITMRGYDLLKNCDVVLYDRLVSKELLDEIPPGCEKVYVGREVGDPTTHQANTNDLMVKYALQGKKVLRLKGGDPIIFGRGGEEAEYLLEHNVNFEIIPGISSAIGSAAYAGIPLTHRQYSSSLAIVTGHEDPEKRELAVRWERLVNAVDTIVILMGMGQLEKLISNLIDAGMDPDIDVAIIENGTTLKQRVVSASLKNILQHVHESGIKSPAIIVIGKVVSLQKNLAWFKGDTDGLLEG